MFLGTEVLLPDPGGADDVVARVGDVSITERHAFERFLQENPSGARQLLELLELDALVASAARRYGITVERARLDGLVREDEDKLRAQVVSSGTTWERALERQFAMTPEHFRALRERAILRQLFREYVVRYTELRRDRVEVRYIVHSDRRVLEDVEQRVRQGASFATLAIRHSEDPNRIEGGLLAPFGSGFDHPVAEVALQLGEGELSEIFLRQSQGAERYYLVFCLRKLAGRDLPFADVKEEIERGVEQRPLTQPELDNARMSLKVELDGLKNDAPSR